MRITPVLRQEYVHDVLSSQKYEVHTVAVKVSQISVGHRDVSNNGYIICKL